VSRHIETQRLALSPSAHALELLSKHLGLFEQTDPNDDRPIVPVFLMPAGARVATKFVPTSVPTTVLPEGARVATK
jgi:hypothetical protein